MELEQAMSEVGDELGFQLKPKQIAAMKAFVEGKDVFVSLPTGYGNPSFMLFCQLYMTK